MKLRYFLILAAVLGWFAHDGKAQTTPDCTQSTTFTTATHGASIQATTGSPAGCSTWRLTFWSTGFTGYTISLQSSQDNSTFADITTTGDILEGTNPTIWTSATTDNSTVIRAYFPYYRVNVGSVTGSGTIHALLLGYKGTSGAPGSGGSGSSTVVIAGNGTVLSGQQSVTASAAALATNAANSICVKASIANTINVYAGPSGVSDSTGLELTPGSGFCQLVTNTNLIYVIASTTGASVSWIASKN